MPRYLPDRTTFVRETPVAELVLEVCPPRRTRSWEFRHEDKELCDDLIAWWFQQTGQRLTQWELASLLIAEASSKEDGVFAGWSPRAALAPPARVRPRRLRRAEYGSSSDGG